MDVPPVVRALLSGPASLGGMHSLLWRVSAMWLPLRGLRRLQFSLGAVGYRIRAAGCCARLLPKLLCLLPSCGACVVSLGASCASAERLFNFLASLAQSLPSLAHLTSRPQGQLIAESGTMSGGGGKPSRGRMALGSAAPRGAAAADAKAAAAELQQAEQQHAKLINVRGPPALLLMAVAWRGWGAGRVCKLCMRVGCCCCAHAPELVTSQADYRCAYAHCSCAHVAKVGDAKQLLGSVPG